MKKDFHSNIAEEKAFQQPVCSAFCKSSSSINSSSSSSKPLYLSGLMGYYCETEFDISAGFGSAWPFRDHEFLVILVTILSRI